MTRLRVFGLALVVGLAGLAAVSPAVARAAPNPPPVQHPKAPPFAGFRLLTVKTVPPVPGAQFSIDGRNFGADGKGVAQTLVTPDQRGAIRTSRDAHLTVATPTIEYRPGVRARFAGWSGGGDYRPGTPPNETQTATFGIEYLTSFSFVAPKGDSVPTRRLTSMRLRSGTGQVLDLHTFDSIWLQGSRAATGPNGLAVVDVSYYVDRVIASGANVVNTAQQRLFPSHVQQARIKVLFFDARFSVNDALFRGTTGSSIALELPDGTVRDVKLGKHGTAVLRGLPRGTYHATVHGSGPALAQPLTLSRNERVDLKVLTWLDIAVLGSVLVGVVVTILVVARRIRRRRRVVLDLVALEERAGADSELVGTP